MLDLISSVYYLIYTWQKWVYLFCGIMSQCQVVMDTLINQEKVIKWNYECINPDYPVVENCHVI